jgi:hypothetical protein
MSWECSRPRREFSAPGLPAWSSKQNLASSSSLSRQTTWQQESLTGRIAQSQRRNWGGLPKALAWISLRSGASTGGYAEGLSAVPFRRMLTAGFPLHGCGNAAVAAMHGCVNAKSVQALGANQESRIGREVTMITLVTEESTLPEDAESGHADDDLTAQRIRRRDAERRLPPLDCGCRDPREPHHMAGACRFRSSRRAVGKRAA